MSIPYSTNVFEDARANEFFRKEITTLGHVQVTLMSIPPGGEVGLETHNDVDQILIFLAGKGEATMNGIASPIQPGSLFSVPLGTEHNFVNTGDEPMKIISVYSPPEHPVGTIHKDKAEADAAEHTPAE